jgi:hypothetical protein
MGAALGVRRVLVDEPDVGFVDERRRLEGVIRPFPAQVAAGEPPQLLVDDRGKLVKGRLVAVFQSSSRRVTFRVGMLPLG